MCFGTHAQARRLPNRARSGKRSPHANGHSKTRTWSTRVQAQRPPGNSGRITSRRPAGTTAGPKGHAEAQFALGGLANRRHRSPSPLPHDADSLLFHVASQLGCAVHLVPLPAAVAGCVDRCGHRPGLSLRLCLRGYVGLHGVPLGTLELILISGSLALVGRSMQTRAAPYGSPWYSMLLTPSCRWLLR